MSDEEIQQPAAEPEAEGVDDGYDYDDGYDDDGVDMSGARGMRSDYCGELTRDDVDREVTVCG